MYQECSLSLDASNVEAGALMVTLKGRGSGKIEPVFQVCCVLDKFIAHGGTVFVYRAKINILVVLIPHEAKEAFG